MNWYRKILYILQQEPEVWLAYMYGQQLDSIPHLTRTVPRYRGLFFQIAKFFLYMFKYLRVRGIVIPDKPTKYLVFAGTLNQKNSLESTVNCLVSQSENVVAIAPIELLKNAGSTDGYVPLIYTPMTAIKAIILLISRGSALFSELKRVHPLAVSWHFANFCSCYVYLSAFLEILTKLKPEIVITSNDHTASSRCLLAVAHHLDIKTAYMQHASVSNLFPALRVNYAFLDGQCALDTYIKCDSNQPLHKRDVPFPKIFLTGQKKQLARFKGGRREMIGIALNALDEPLQAIILVKQLADTGQQVCLRWHPAQGGKDIERFLTAFADYATVSLSNPMTESVSEFMSRLGWLIAGNSSIHLEAALAGVIPIYYELSPSDIPDYYKYVEHGLANQARSVEEISTLLTSETAQYEPDIDSVRYYSATYLTDWDGKEGELVAECLRNIADDEILPVKMHVLE